MGKLEEIEQEIRKEMDRGNYLVQDGWPPDSVAVWPDGSWESHTHNDMGEKRDGDFYGASPLKNRPSGSVIWFPFDFSKYL